jgi:ABC-type uncharacterized transport system substrate-binding protein
VEPVVVGVRTMIARRRACARATLWRIGCSAHRASLLLALACTSASASADAALKFLVIQGSDAPRLSRTLAALQAHARVPVDVVRLPHARDASLESALTRPERDRVVVALGPRASDLLAALPAAGPVVHCLAGADALRAGLPSVPSEAPADQQAAWLRKLVPAARNVGLLYEPATNARRAEAIAASLDVAGYKVVLQPVGGAAALPSALAALAGRADVLLAVPDRTVYAPEAANGILLFSFRHRIPLVGPNDAWVRRGALFAVDWDYGEVGAACAALALREAQASKSAPMPESPRPRDWVNTKLAPHFGLAWPELLLQDPAIRHE